MYNIIIEFKNDNKFLTALVLKHLAKDGLELIEQEDVFGCTLIFVESNKRYDSDNLLEKMMNLGLNGMFTQMNSENFELEKRQFFEGIVINIINANFLNEFEYYLAIISMESCDEEYLIYNIYGISIENRDNLLRCLGYEPLNVDMLSEEVHINQEDEISDFVKKNIAETKVIKIERPNIRRIK